MDDPLPYQLLADVVLSLHVAIVVFVVGGLILIIIGNLRAWRWVNGVWFRVLHLGLIIIVVTEAWLGAVCPFTTLEMWLRAKAHTATYSESFVEHWLQLILYYQAPAWVFTLVYSLFGLVVAATWWYFPPRSNRRTSPPNQQEVRHEMSKVSIGDGASDSRQNRR